VSEPSDLGAIVDQARKLALSAEQPLLRMVIQRRASIAALDLAATNYARAAELCREASARLKRKEP
jgi:hypothetical protein